MLPLRHRAVYVPEGQYHLPSGVTFTSKSVFLTGDGCENTELRAHSWLVEADDREAPTTVEFAPSPGAVSCITPPHSSGGTALIAPRPQPDRPHRRAGDRCNGDGRG